MDVYVHTVPGGGFPETRMGTEAYRTLDRALAAGRQQSSIECHSLRGALNGVIVYAAHRYDRVTDMHDLVGIYADHASADQAAGNPNFILPLNLDWDSASPTRAATTAS